MGLFGELLLLTDVREGRAGEFWFELWSVDERSTFEGLLSVTRDFFRGVVVVVLFAAALCPLLGAGVTCGMTRETLLVTGCSGW